MAINLQSAAAYTAAGLLVGAAVVTNVSSAVSKMPDLSGKIVGGTVAGGVALLGAVALPACLSALARRRYGSAAAAAAAFVLAAGFSMTTALGTFGGARLQASASVEHVEQTRAGLAEERRRASIELSTIATARAPNELHPEIARILAVPGVDGCAVINGPISRQWCPVLAGLQAELARSQRRSALEGTLARVDADLARLGAPKIANGDAAAIVAVLRQAGMQADPERINVGLMVLSVLLLELGGGLALATAHALRADERSDSGTARPSGSPGSFTPLPTPVQAGPKPVAAGDSGDSSVIRSGLHHATVNPLSVRATQVLDSLRLAGGSATGSQRALAQQLGVSQPVLSRGLAELFEHGVIELRADRRTGTSVRVVTQG